MKIGFPIPNKENERRRAILPRDIQKISHPEMLVIEEGYGTPLRYSDAEYQQAGAVIASRSTVIDCPIICNAKPCLSDEYFQPGKTLFGWIHAVQGRAITDLLIKNKMTAIAWEDMFNGGRHTFWRNNEISGEAAVWHAFLQWGRLPYSSRVALIGQGNAARGALRAMERAGCMVTVYNRRTASLLRKEVQNYDVIVNAVLWDVFRTDHIIYDEDLDKMKHGSLIIDISCDEHMGIESSHSTTIENPVYWHKEILHYVVDHTPALYFQDATDSISLAVAPFLDELITDCHGEVLKSATIVKNGMILDSRITRFQNR